MFYELLETKYEKLYTSFAVDIRPSMVNEVKMMHQGKQVLKLDSLKPTQNGKPCHWVKYANSSLEGLDFSPDSNLQMTDSEKLRAAKSKCEATETIYLGQCNAISMEKPLNSYTMPHPIFTVDEADVKGSLKDREVSVKHCPEKLGLFQAIAEPLKVRYSEGGAKMTLDLHVSFRLHEVPSGGLVYMDHVHYEGRHHSMRWLELAESRDLQKIFNSLEL